MSGVSFCISRGTQREFICRPGNHAFLQEREPTFLLQQSSDGQQYLNPLEKHYIYGWLV